MNRAIAPLRHRVQSVRAREGPKGILSMESSFPGILRRGEEPNEPQAIGISNYSSFQTNLRSYLWVSTHPQLCVNRIYISSAFEKKSKSTLRRLAFSRRESVRHAAEMEIMRRETVNHYFPNSET